MTQEQFISEFEKTRSFKLTDRDKKIFVKYEHNKECLESILNQYICSVRYTWNGKKIEWAIVCSSTALISEVNSMQTERRKKTRTSLPNDNRDGIIVKGIKSVKTYDILNNKSIYIPPERWEINPIGKIPTKEDEIDDFNNTVKNILYGAKLGITKKKDGDIWR